MKKQTVQNSPYADDIALFFTGQDAHTIQSILQTVLSAANGSLITDCL